jgi:DNA-binding IclR family transcriptional regulator
MATPINGSMQLGFSIIREFAAHDAKAYTLTELARQMDLPVPTVHRFLKTLVYVGALARHPRGRYSLGAYLADLARAVPYEELLRLSSEHVVRALARDLGAIVHLSVLDAGMAKFIVKEHGNRALQTDTKVGARFEAYCTASGKVLLAGLQEEDFDDYLLSGRCLPFTPNTITDRTKLRREIERIRRDKLAYDREEFQEGVVCWAVPIVNSMKHTVAALSVSFRPQVAEPAPAEELIDALRVASRAITEKMCAHYGSCSITPIAPSLSATL